MRIDVLSLFPSMFSPLEESIIGRAKKKGLLDLNIVDIRKFARDKHRTADDTPYGGGAGMVMKPELISDALDSIKKNKKKSRVIYLSPSGKRFDNDMAKELSKYDQLVLICGHYEGIDERVKTLVDEEISVGDHVLTGGELPAMVIIDTVSRFVKGVLGHKDSANDESFSNGLLEYPQYTRPSECRGLKVPDVLLSGDHKKIAQWRRKMSVVNTFFKRPDLLSLADIGTEDMATLEAILKGNLQ
jgi:tRNA (guanine37-N1)-methyltransferase